MQSEADVPGAWRFLFAGHVHDGEPDIGEVDIRGFDFDAALADIHDRFENVGHTVDVMRGPFFVTLHEVQNRLITANVLFCREPEFA